MLYLIQSLVEKDNGDIFKILKIGYTDNLDSRMKSYYSHNPGTKLLETREGDTNFESLFHSYFRKYKYEEEEKNFDEWFYWNEEIVSGFSSLEKEDLIDPEYIQKKYENYFIKNFLTSPEDLLSRYWEDLRKDLEDKVKSTPSLSEFLDLEYLKSRFKERLTEIYGSLEDYIRGIDYLRTLKENRLDLDFLEFNLKILFSSIFPQIVGYQRDESNPFKNIINLFYRIKQKDETEITLEEFKDLQEDRKKSTEAIINGFKKLSDFEKSKYIQKLKYSIQVSRHSDDFVSISKHTNLPVYNYLVDIANEKAWEVSQKEYQNKISITKSLNDQGFTLGEYQSEDDKIASDFLDNHFYKTGIFREKLKMYCEFMDLNAGNLGITEIVNSKIPNPRFRQFYDYFGTKGCSSRSYEEKRLLEAWGDDSKEEKLLKEICLNFKIGGRYSMKELKSILQGIYDSLGISKKAKATDLGRYFKLSKTSITLPDKSVVNGFRLDPLKP